MTGNRLAIAATVVLVGLAPILAPAYYVVLFSYVGISALTALGLVLLTGIAGQVSFGQAAFVGISAYTTAVLTTDFGLSPWFALVCSLLITSVAALVIGLSTLRLSGHYLAVASIAWGISITIIFGNVQGLGGHSGLTGIPGLSPFSSRPATDAFYLYLIWAFLLLAMILSQNLLDSRPGRALRAISAPSGFVRHFGVSPAYHKLMAFVIAADLAALSGWLYAHMVRYVNPSPFIVTAGITYLFMIVIGGRGHVWAAVVGAIVVQFVQDLLNRILPNIMDAGGNLEALAFAVVVILILHNAGGGILDVVHTRLDRPSRREPADDTPVKALPPRAPPASDNAPLLRVENVERRFGGLVATRDLSFDLRRGEILGVIGPNGAGKTTLFNLVTGKLAPNAGTITFAGEDITHWDPARIFAAGIARTFQHVELIAGMSSLDNAALGAHLRGRAGVVRSALRANRTEERALLAEAARNLRRVGLGDALATPAGRLPLGQQRLLEVARALSSDPLLLMLDEPAAGLRHNEKQALLAALQEIRREGISILIVEHDMEFVMQLVDRLVVMEFGAKIAEGAPADIQKNAHVIAAYLGEEELESA